MPVTNPDEDGDLDAPLLSHPGQVAYTRWEGLKRVYDVWDSNTLMLRAVLHRGEAIDEVVVELVQNDHEPVIRDNYFRQLDRAILAFTASMVSLIEHTRTLVRRYAETPFSAEYATRSSEIVGNTGFAFLRKYRDYLLHYAVSPLTVTASLQGSGPMAGQILLETPVLLNWKGWNAASEEYLDAHPDTVRLSELLEPYDEQMHVLYAWLFGQLESLHGQDFAARNALLREINLKMSGGLYGSQEEFLAGAEKSRRSAEEASGQKPPEA
jgi:hypothetical protein